MYKKVIMEVETGQKGQNRRFLFVNFIWPSVLLTLIKKKINSY